MAVATLVVAAGSGRRFGGPKQFEALGGASLVEHAVAAATSVSSEVVVALPAGRLESIDGARVVAGGATRSESVRRAFAALEGRPDFVLVHDAARPLAPVSVFERVIARLAKGADAVVPVLAIPDTVKQVEGDRVRATIDRSTLRAAQTPQGFRYDVLRAVVESAMDGTDDAAVAESLGYEVVVVQGAPRARKVTTRQDLHELVGVRVGFGVDQHAVSRDPGRHLVLGGVRVAGAGLEAHSDGDVVAHAVADAILGAAGIGGIGDVYRDSDPALRGADSMALLRGCLERVWERGLRVAQVDVTILAERPHLAGELGSIAANLERVLGGSVLVKAKRPEGLGALGRGEGLAAAAVALLEGLLGDES